MKVLLSIEDGFGSPISTYSFECGEGGGEVVCTASTADLALTAGITWDEFQKLGIPWNGVRFRAKLIPDIA